jgi:hypothetical protein
MGRPQRYPPKNAKATDPLPIAGGPGRLTLCPFRSGARAFAPDSAFE